MPTINETQNKKQTEHQPIKLSQNLVSTIQTESQRVFAFILNLDARLEVEISTTKAFGWDDDPKTAFQHNFKSIEPWFQSFSKSVSFVLVQLGELPLSSTYADWLLITFVPENASAKERSSVEGVEKQLRDEFCHDHKIVQTLRATKKVSVVDVLYEFYIPTNRKQEECTYAAYQDTSAALIAAFAQAASIGSTPFAFSVGIENGQLVERMRVEGVGAFEESFSNLESLYAEKTPGFVLVRLDKTVAAGESAWLVVQYVPDGAHVREKMVYASSKAALVRELGDFKFIDVLFATSKEECTLAGYKAHLAHKSAEAPRTEKEIEAELLKRTETGAEIGMSTRKEIAASGGLGFTFTEEAVDALRGLNEGAINFVALSIVAETITVGSSSHSASPDNLRTLIPDSEPFFVFFKYAHLHDGASQDPVLFFYICPPSAKVKSRMLFSSSRASALDYVEKNIGITVLKKIELDSASEIDQAFIDETLYPPKTDLLTSTKAAFKKPSRPGKK
ncbi:UNVERIFIED_CONTAM: Twinfilin-1 [Siphonaria sp. JEL0065]|nr:Twinfilin-1 [Siphonaria sp. JEL0065]